MHAASHSANFTHSILGYMRSHSVDYCFWLRAVQKCPLIFIQDLLYFLCEHPYLILAPFVLLQLVAECLDNSDAEAGRPSAPQPCDPTQPWSSSNSTLSEHLQNSPPHVCVCVCVCVCSIMAMHPMGMGRYDAPAMYNLLRCVFSNSEANHETCSPIV